MSGLSDWQPNNIFAVNVAPNDINCKIQTKQWAVTTVIYQITTLPSNPILENLQHTVTMPYVVKNSKIFLIICNTLNSF